MNYRTFFSSLNSLRIARDIAVGTDGKRSQLPGFRLMGKLAENILSFKEEATEAARQYATGVTVDFSALVAKAKLLEDGLGAVQAGYARGALTEYLQSQLEAVTPRVSASPSHTGSRLRIQIAGMEMSEADPISQAEAVAEEAVQRYEAYKAKLDAEQAETCRTPWVNLREAGQLAWQAIEAIDLVRELQEKIDQQIAELRRTRQAEAQKRATAQTERARQREAARLQREVEELNSALQALLV
jgi:hypothetical protein